MPASTIVASGGQIRLYDDSVQTFEELPVGTYAIEFSQMSGYSLRAVEPLGPGHEPIYGSHPSRVERILSGYRAMSRSLGVILSGDKGMGKSLMIRMLAERARDDLGLPTVLVQHSTPALASFLNELGECLIVFDEFEKVFAPDSEGDEGAQNQFLSLFDGLSTTKRLYALSVNNLHRVSDYMLNRPGRFHYHMRFEYPDPQTVERYLRDQVPGAQPEHVDEVVDFSRKYDVNFDHLRAIAFELALGVTFSEVIGDLNIKRVSSRGGDPVQARITWADGDTDVISGHVDLFDSDRLQAITDWSLDVELRFRMRDAVPSQEGYLLPPGSFELVDVRDEEQRQESDQDRVAGNQPIVLRRPEKASLDF